MPAIIVSDGVRVNYVAEGDGPPVMAISGFMSTIATSQYRMAPGLAREFRLVYGDHRGAGASDCPPGPYTIDRIADDWIAIMDAEDIESAPVLGNSMGSAIAQSMALRYPDRVERLVLSVPIAAADEFLQSLVGHLRRTCENDGARAYAMQSLLWTLAPENFNRMAPALRMLIDEKPPEVDMQGMRGQEAALCGFDLRDRAGDIGCPTLIVAAREDKVCPVYQAEALAGLIRGSQLVVVEGAGHLVQSEAPQAWSDAVLPFLRG